MATENSGWTKRGSPTKTLTLTNAQFIQLPVATFYDIVPAPGSGKIIIPTSITIRTKWTVAYTASLQDNDYISIGSTYGFNPFSGFIQKAVSANGNDLASFLATASDCLYFLPGININSYPTGLGTTALFGPSTDNLENSALGIIATCNSGVAFGGGHANNTTKFIVGYQIISI